MTATDSGLICDDQDLTWRDRVLAAMDAPQQLDFLEVAA